MGSDKFYGLLKKVDALHSLALNHPTLTAPVRAVSYLFYRLLELALGERHPHERVLAQAKRLQRAAPPHKPTSSIPTRVLFVTLRGWFVHSSVQALLAKALELRGAQPSFVLCGGGFSQCDFKPASDFQTTSPLCWRCKTFTRQLLDSLALPQETLGALDLQPIRELAHTLAWNTDASELRDFEYQGMPLYEWCFASIRRTLLRGDAGQGRLSDAVVRGYLESAIIYVEASRQLIERHRPDVCVVLNGLFHAERVFSEVARAAGVRVVSYEVGFRPQTFHFTETGGAAHFPVDQLWQQQRNMPLDEAAEVRLETYFRERSQGGGVVSIYWPRMDSRREHLAERLGLRPDLPMAVLFPNIAWDSATVRLDTVFRTMKHWVEETIEMFANHPDKQLVIRIHPAEIRLPMMETRDPIGEHLRVRYPNLPPNIRLVAADDPANSYELLAMSDSVLVYTSTLGLEAAAQGRRVVVAARPHYANHGFTDDVQDSAQYEKLVMDSMRSPQITDEQRTLARRYADMLLYKYMVDFPWVVDIPRESRGLDIDALENLAPGHSSALDQLCDTLLGRQAL